MMQALKLRRCFPCFSIKCFSAQLSEAAVLVQSRVRGNIARKAPTPNQQAAAVKVQSHVRSSAARKEVQAGKEQGAALTIQKHSRGQATRKEVHNEAQLEIQKAELEAQLENQRVKLVAEATPEMNAAATTLQASTRDRAARNAPKHAAATTVQKQIRGNLARQSINDNVQREERRIAWLQYYQEPDVAKFDKAFKLCVTDKEIAQARSRP